VRAQIQEHIQSLRLIDLDEETLDAILSWAAAESPSSSEIIERLLGTAAGKKRERRVQARFAQSGLKEKRTLEAFDWSFPDKIDRPTIEELASLDFIRQRDNLIFTGNPGTGKSHILKALVLRACAANCNVLYARCVDLTNYLYKGLADDSYERRLKRWARAQFVAIDDVGFGHLKKRPDEPTAAHMLFNLIDLRSQQVSTALSFNIKLGEWGTYLGDATITGAILDRLVETAIRVDIEGPSYRQHRARQRAEARAKKTPSKQKR
jgi:DNA replication protein DnaC